uniref:NAD-dependent epimerase/dehydratase domain-containing protein n=1 Tax=Romanomermis culicivorax TaxID=13658 RepID=A0A915JEH1_ROMCU
MSVLIGGGSGFVGANLIALLKRNGVSSRIISRRSGLENSITWVGKKIAGDEFQENFANQIVKEGIPENVEHVVNLAGAPLADFTKNWQKGYKKEVFDSRIETTKILAEAIGRKTPGSKLKTFVQTSAVGYYPYSDTVEYTEDSHVTEELGNIFVKLCKEWEAAGELPETRRDVRRLIFRFELSFFAGRPCCLGTPSFVVKCIFDPDRAEMALKGQKVVPKRTLESGFRFQYPKIDQACDAIIYKCI